MRADNPRLDIELSALCANYRGYQRRAGQSFTAAGAAAVAAAVVKCDGYGLGAEAVALTLHAREGCRVFFVAYSEEGAAVRRAVGPDAEILVFNGPFENTLGLFRDFSLTPVLNSAEQAALWASAAPGAPAALHIDTGMNRLGVKQRQAAAIAAIDGLKINLVMSHLACASDAGHAMNAAQLVAFNEAARLFPKARRSLAASGGALIAPEFNCDVLRIGVGLYGIEPLDAPAASGFLTPVAALTAPVIAVHTIARGESVGYGASFIAPSDMRLATVALGYGDGFPRAGSNSASAILGEVKCPIVGRVSMDLIVLDATRAAPVRIGDRAEFFGARLRIEDAAAACGTLAYELLTNIGGLARPQSLIGGGLGGRVRRRYLFAGAPASLAGAEGNCAEGN